MVNKDPLGCYNQMKTNYFVRFTDLCGKSDIYLVLWCNSPIFTFLIVSSHVVVNLCSDQVSKQISK